MRVGISTPVVVQLPGATPEWERSATAADLALIARAADDLGFDHLTCSEHVAVPVDMAAARGATYWDPVATLSFLAAHTTRIRLATAVVVLGYHHPLEIAKRYGTVDLISDGRLVLGVGVGTLRAEFGLLGAEYHDRGPRADDAMAALRASLSLRQPSYRGTHYAFEDFIVEPHAVQARVPLWVGGSTSRSLRRAVETGDGWMPFGLTAADISTMLAAIDRTDGFELVLSQPASIDPLGDPDTARVRLDHLGAAGATIAQVRITARSAHHYCDQLARLRDLAGDLV